VHKPAQVVDAVMS